MDNNNRESISIRLVSTAFMVVAIAIFKPFGLEMWQWQSCLHLSCILALGLFSCLVTEMILRYLVDMPQSYQHGVSYIISRNLRFQLINTPLVALLICLYRHFVMSSHVASNRLSLGNYLETLVIIAFLSFAIGLYWRFKFRSKYLAMELQEILELNKQLQSLAASPSAVEARSGEGGAEEEIVLHGTTNDSVTLRLSDLLYIEAVGNYAKVRYLRDGQLRTDMLRATMKQMEETLHIYPKMVRCHRAFLVNLSQVEQIASHAGSTQLLIRHCHESVPVSRSNMAQVKAAIQQVNH